MPTVDGLPYPNSSATPDVPGDILALVQAVSRKMGAGVAYAADSAGLAALVTDGLVKPGMLALQFDTRTLWFRETSTWVPAGQMMHPHAEFTATSGSAANATLSPVGTLAIDATRSTNTTFVTPGVSSLTFAAAGTYALSTNSVLAAAATGTSFIQAQDGGGVLLGRVFGSAPFTQISGPVLANHITVTAGETVDLRFWQTTGGSRVLTSRFAVTRIS